MIHYNHFIMAESLDEAYELNRKKSAVICGGFCWLTSEPHSSDDD